MSKASAESDVALDFNNVDVPTQSSTRGGSAPKPSTTTSSSSRRTLSKGNHKNSAVTVEGLTVIIAKGNISEQTVEGLVNSVGGDMDMTAGAISQSILKKAGPGIQTELTKNKPGDIHYGQVVVTEGHNLSAKWVFHGVLKKWDSGKGDSEKIVRSFATSVLTEASKKGVKSIAFPAVGTGILAFPADLVATVLFDVVDNFSMKNPVSSVTEVHFVIYEKDLNVWSAFETKMSELSKAPATTNTVYTPAMLINNLKIKSVENKAEVTALGIKVPDNWSPVDPFDPYRKVKLDETSAEYKAVEKNARETCANKIVKIERIENYVLYEHYQLAKSHVSKNCGSEVEAERQLWHGTAEDALKNIFAGGFNRSYCGKNATFFGQGVYFAKNFSYSAQLTYSPPNGDGNRFIFQCRVLTGYTTNGNPDMKEPPMRTRWHRYDSVTNDVDDPAIFVVFKDSLAYPEYLVTFK